MEYTHPKHYEGLKVDTPNSQLVARAIVEEYCLKCDKFMGKEHDFSECRTHDIWKNGRIIKKKMCPFDCMAVSLIEPGMEVKCRVEK